MAEIRQERAKHQYTRNIKEQPPTSKSSLFPLYNWIWEFIKSLIKAKEIGYILGFVDLNLDI